jgi:predicted XRE-type DNA-binding protein
MQLDKLVLRAGDTVTHPSFAGGYLPEQAVIVEVYASQLAELSNGLRLPQRELLRVETGERWATVAEYERYSLSSQGKVVSLAYQGGQRERLLKVLAPTTRPMVALTNEQGSRQLRLSRLVAQTFLPPPPDARQRSVLPKDGNPLNVHVENLHWADRADMQDEVMVHYLYRRGERHAQSKLTTQEVARIRELVAQGATKQAVAVLFEVSRPTISSIVRGLTRRHT